MIRLALLALALLTVIGCGHEAAKPTAVVKSNADLPGAAAAPGWAVDSDMRETGR